MKARLSFIITILVAITLTAGLVWSDDPQGRSVCYLLPVEAAGINPNPDTFDKVIFSAVYNFLGILPALSLPDAATLQNSFWMSSILFRWDRLDRKAVPPQIWQADYITFGDYEFTSRAKDRAKIRLSIWSKKESAVIASSEFLTTTDMEIFDTVEKIQEFLVTNILKTEYKLARLRFDINGGKDGFEIRVNGRLIKDIREGSFTSTLAVLAGQNYHVEVRRKRDGRTIIDTSRTLGVSEAMDLTYYVNGSIRIHPVLLSAPGESFGYVYNRKNIEVPLLITNLSTLNTFTLTVTNQKGQPVYDRPVQVQDGETTDLYPGLNTLLGRFIPRIYAFGGGWGGVEMQYLALPNFYLALGCGISTIQIENLGKTVPSLTGSLTAGYHLWMSPDRVWKAGAGLTLLGYYDFTAGIYDSINKSYFGLTDPQPFSLGAGILVFADWNLISLQLGLNYDFEAGSFYFSPAIGVKF